MYWEALGSRGWAFDWCKSRPLNTTLIPQNWGSPNSPSNYGQMVADGATLWIDRRCEVVVVANASKYSVVSHCLPTKIVSSISAALIPQFVGFCCFFCHILNYELKSFTFVDLILFAVISAKRELSFAAIRQRRHAHHNNKRGRESRCFMVLQQLRLIVPGCGR